MIMGDAGLNEEDKWLRYEGKKKTKQSLKCLTIVLDFSLKKAPLKYHHTQVVESNAYES